MSTHPNSSPGCLVRRVANLMLGILLAWLSVPVVINLLSSKQIMNTSFSPLRIVNTYGAFGRYRERSPGNTWLWPHDWCSDRPWPKHILCCHPSTAGRSRAHMDVSCSLHSITKERTEVIIQGTASVNASAPDAVWEDYEFKCKPGNPWRRPCLISPYHYRLDWLMWFAAFQVRIFHHQFPDLLHGGDIRNRGSQNGYPGEVGPHLS